MQAVLNRLGVFLKLLGTIAWSACAPISVYRMAVVTKGTIKRSLPSEAGFSLIELSLVMVILALLVGPVLIPLQQQRTELTVRATEKQLEEAREALIGYALLMGHLPCPDYQSDPNQADYGLAASDCSHPSSEGWFPFRSLGLVGNDVGFGRIFYRVDPAFAGTQPITANTSFSEAALSIYDQQSRKLTSDVERPVAILFSAGPNMELDGENASFEPTAGRYEAHPPTAPFDDIVVWVGRPSLLATLIKGGKGF
jgi:prepilin-type N-terminal cleavage/methylation domain-containing protein